ncbi:MAG: hypothetical protein Pg6B_07650 [Candidatus Azobacteroides pseudotrichonymphae]|jgi:hypothetical protein|nr:MAG: hypothetical protein Pg6B_07650 [Candidatus Azobacteroides pseudotrichonymphae]
MNHMLKKGIKIFFLEKVFVKFVQNKFQLFYSHKKWEEYRQCNFDFLTMCENSIFVRYNNIESMKTMGKFLGVYGEETKAIVRSI